MLDGARKFTFPADLLEGNPDAALVCVPIPVLPYLRRFFAQMQSAYIWKTPEDFERAYPVFSAIEAQMTSACVSNITESIDRLYRLMDNALNGTAYTANGEVVTPAIPAAPAKPDGVTTGLRRQLLDAQGVLPSSWPFGFGNKPATTADVVRALRADSEDQIERATETLDLLESAAQTATIFNVVRDFLTDGASVTAEGGILIATLVGLMSNAAMMGLQAKQLDSLLAKMDRLITSLDGGATSVPTTNVIAELQDVNEKLV